MRKYVIMGVQGSGKGTQSQLLAADLDIVHISVGDIFRWNVQNHTKIGRVLNRRLCVNCGMDYNLIANSPKVAGQCDSCGGQLVTREDDTEEALAVRLRDYHTQTEPALDLFRRKEYVFTVDARPAPDVVQEQIRKCLGLPPFEQEKKGPGCA